MSNNQQEEQDNFDIRKFIFKVIQNWPYFVFSIIVSVLIAFLIIRYTDPKYKLKATVLVKDESSASLGAESILEGLELFQGKKNLENEIGIIKSRSLIQKTLSQLDFDVSYFTQGDVRKVEYYHSFPFTVDIDTSHLQILNTPVSIKLIDKNEFEYEIKGEDVRLINFSDPDEINPTLIQKISTQGKGYFGQVIETNYYKFKIFPARDLGLFKDKKLIFIVNHPERIADYYEKELSVTPINKKASILELTLEGSVVEKEKAFLNKLASVYIESGLEEKNEIASNTISFIDKQLSGITDSLRTAEEDLQSFRANNNVLDITISTKVIIEKLEKLENEKAIINLKFKYYNYLRDYLLSNKDVKEIIAPSAMGIEDPLLNNQIYELAKLNNEKSALMINSTEKNPYLNVLQQKIKSTKATLLENLNNIVETSDISLKDINARISSTEKEVNKLPATERKLVNIQRKFLLNDNIYNFLLEKRAEAGIAKAANTADNRILDRAKLAENRPSSPKKSLFYLIALFVGIAIPLGIIIVIDMFNDRIVSREEIEEITSLPIIGMIGHIDENENRILVSDLPKSPIAESFRSIRTNLQYLSSDLDKRIIGITSSISGEGKTFFSINLGIIVSLTNKRTLLIGTDMRKPTISNYFDLKNDKGLSSYLIGNHSLNQIIQKTRFDNLDIITSGPIPPNPSELLLLGKVQELFDEVGSMYDYIIIDSSPIGLVADYFSLAKYVDINLYLVRLGYTPKEVIRKVDLINQKDKFKNLSVVLNDVSRVNGYGYGYNYGYNYSYDQQPVKKGIFTRMFSRKIG